MPNLDKNDCCGQISMTFETIFWWSLAVVDRWSFFRGRFSTKTVWAGFRVGFFILTLADIGITFVKTISLFRQLTLPMYYISN
jgi:hypothetical protein